MNNQQQIKTTYKIFCKAEGNQHIASEFAILKLQELIEKFKVKNILEVGLGIGAIAGSLLAANRHLIYTGTENNEFCLKSLKQNLGKEYNRLKIHSGIAEVGIKGSYDLIIIDGKDYDLQRIRTLISRNGIITIEGDRLEQHDEVLKIFPHHLYVHCISSKKNKEYSPFPIDHWEGGVKIIFIDPFFLSKNMVV